MIYKNIKYKLVDTAGQITAVVLDGVNNDKKSMLSKYLMNQNNIIEQVVFLKDKQIRTMGNELCINGSLAGAYLSTISGLDEPIKFTKTKKYITANFPTDLVVKVINDTVLLQGIVYLISNDDTKINKLFLKKLAKQYNVQASGIIKFDKNEITPIVYGLDTNSLVWENACGSGSLAYSVFSGLTKIIQPSGQIIIVKKNQKSFTIKVAVKIIQ
jgi:hypothetical protein